MSSTWFVIKSLFLTFGIISFLQMRFGSDSRTLEVVFTDWMKNLSASRRIQDVAQGGKNFTADVIKEFTTPDGHKIYIQEKINPQIEIDNGRDVANTPSTLDSSIIKRLVGGLKLDYTDLNAKDQVTVKEQFRREIEKEVRKDYENKLKKSGIDPNTLESLN